MRGVQSNGSDVDIDLARLWESVRERWRTIATVAVAVTLIAFVAAWLATPLYRAETRILIETRESVYTRNSGSGEAERPILDEGGITSQVEVVGSNDILRQVADDLDLAGRDEFRAGGLMATIGLGEADPDVRERAVVDIMREKLTVYRVEGSRVIVVRFSSQDPQLAAAVPNAIADAYINEQRAAKLLSNADATEWLAPEIADLRERVRNAEAAVASFRGQSDLLIGQNNSTLASQQLSELSSELSRVRAARSAAESRAEGVRQALETGASLDAVPEVLSSPIIQRLREREVQLNAEIADLSTTLLDAHPRLRGLRSQLADLSGRIRTEARTVLESLENEALTAQRREVQLQAELDALKAQSVAGGNEEVELRALEREATAQRELLESYLTRYREASSRGDRNYLPVDARIFSRATAPIEPYYPKYGPIMAAAFFGSILIMGIVTLLGELFSGRAMRAAPAPRMGPVPSVVMPAAATAVSNDLSADDDGTGPRSVEATAAILIGDGTSRAVFLSPEGEDASAASVMVAREMADAGLRVVFVDLTFSGLPSSLMLESRAYTGITNLLSAEAQFTDTIHGDLYSDCHVIPVGTADAQRAMRAADRLPIILTSLNTAYDIVIVECGPADVASLSRVAGEGARIVVGIVEQDEARLEGVLAALEGQGFGDVMLVSPAGSDDRSGELGRTVA